MESDNMKHRKRVATEIDCTFNDGYSLAFKIEFTEKLKSWDAYKELIAWFQSLYFQSLEELWVNMERPDWMLWLASRLGVEEKQIVLAGIDCAEWALRFIPKNELRPKNAIAAARRYLNGGCTIAELNRATELIECADDMICSGYYYEISREHEAVAHKACVAIKEACTAAYATSAEVKARGGACATRSVRAAEKAARMLVLMETRMWRERLCDLIRKRINMNAASWKADRSEENMNHEK